MKDAIELFEEIGYTEYSDNAHYDFYMNKQKGLTIEIRKYVDEFIKYNTDDRTKRRGINTKELQAITKAFEELGYIKEEIK